jgi:DNA (cytosine-5)-methyltransferase 1
MKKKYKNFNFIDLFAGIGGFHVAMHRAGGKCVFASEWDKYARITYEANYRKFNPEIFDNGFFNSDINDANPHDIPDFDVLCAGFPCQPFSNAGLKKGFEDTRGTLFFNIAEIISTKISIGRPPRVVLLENVKGLKGHDKGKTLKTILKVLMELGYNVDFKILNSKHFGLPQNRERLFIVAWMKTDDSPEKFHFPLGIDNKNKIIFDEFRLTNDTKKVKVGNILQPQVDKKYTISDKLYNGHKRRLKEHQAKGNGFGFSLFNENSPYTSTISARYYKDGSEILIAQDGANPRKLSPREAGLLQGYPMDTDFKLVVSDAQAYKQFGNSVSVPVVTSLAFEIKKQLL